MARKPYADTRLTKYIEKRTLELRQGKSQRRSPKRWGSRTPT